MQFVSLREQIIPFCFGIAERLSGDIAAGIQVIILIADLHGMRQYREAGKSFFAVAEDHIQLIVSPTGSNPVPCRVGIGVADGNKDTVIDIPFDDHVGLKPG